jgi:hypothetical protein
MAGSGDDEDPPPLDAAAMAALVGLDAPAAPRRRTERVGPPEPAPRPAPAAIEADEELLTFGGDLDTEPVAPSPEPSSVPPIARPSYGLRALAMLTFVAAAALAYGTYSRARARRAVVPAPAVAAAAPAATRSATPDPPKAEPAPPDEPPFQPPAAAPAVHRKARPAPKSGGDFAALAARVRGYGMPLDAWRAVEPDGIVARCLAAGGEERCGAADLERVRAALVRGHTDRALAGERAGQLFRILRARAESHDLDRLRQLEQRCFQLKDEVNGLPAAADRFWERARELEAEIRR